MSTLKMPNDDVVEKYTKLLWNSGRDGVYRHAVGTGVIRSVHTPNPEIETLNTAESFFALYRRTGEEKYFVLGRILRRAAHKIYREFLRIHEDKAVNMRFLNVVR